MPSSTLASRLASGLPMNCVRSISNENRGIIVHTLPLPFEQDAAMALGRYPAAFAAPKEGVVEEDSCTCSFPDSNRASISLTLRR